MQKLIKCINNETGAEVEFPEHITKDAGMMTRMNLTVKPEIRKISQKEILVKLKDATTVEEIDTIMDGEDREKCIEYANERKKEITK